MTSIQQRAELQRRIWQIANEVRGAVDGWDFKQYVLGALFYRFISENFIDYITGGDASVNYAAMADDDENIEAAKDDAIKTKGYFIYPSELFVNVAAGANTNESLNTKLAQVFKAIEASAIGYPSEQDIKGLFADFDTTSNRLGNTVKDKNARLAAVLKGVAELDFGGFDATQQADYRQALAAIKRRIQTSQTRAVLAVNAELLALYWDIGRQLDSWQRERAWGSAVVEQMAQDLQATYPGMKGFSRTSLFAMRQFYAFFSPQFEVVPQPVGQITNSCRNLNRD